MKPAKYFIELVVTVACSYCAYYLCSAVDTWNAYDSIFYIFGIIFMIVIGIVCICDVIENIYYFLK